MIIRILLSWVSEVSLIRDNQGKVTAANSAANSRNVDALGSTELPSGTTFGFYNQSSANCVVSRATRIIRVYIPGSKFGKNGVIMKICLPVRPNSLIILLFYLCLVIIRPAKILSMCHVLIIALRRCTTLMLEQKNDD